MKKKSFTRALAGISAAVFLAVSLIPQTIPAMAAENNVSEGGVSQGESAVAAQPAEADQEQVPKGQTDQTEAGEAGESDSPVQQPEADLSENAGEIVPAEDETGSASDDSAATEEAAAGEPADAEEDAAEGQTISELAGESVRPEGAITVTYEASEGGHVSKESETFVKGEESAVLTGAVAEPEDGYEFVDWTEDGVEVSTDAVFVPDVTAIDADVTFTANFQAKEAEETYPAVDFAPMKMSDGTEILVSAPEGAFPVGVQMRASVVKPDQVIGAIAEATPDDDEVNAEQIAAYDISFYLPADPDTEVEPRKPVQVSFENLPLQDEVTKDSSLEVWHIDDSHVANAGDIENQSTDGDVSVSIKAQSFSTYAIRAKAQKAVSSDYDFNSVVDLSDNIKITPETTAMQDLSGTISVEIQEQEILGNIKTAYDSIKKSLGFFGGLRLEYWKDNALADRTKSIIPITITLPEGLIFQNVQTSSEGASLLIISGDKGNVYLPATVTDGNKLTVYLNFTGSLRDASVCYLSEVLDKSAEDGVLKISAQYQGKMAEGTDEKNIRVNVSGGAGFLFGSHLAVNVAFTDVSESIPSANVNFAEGTLGTDILVKNGHESEYDTENKAVYQTAPGETLSFAADVDVFSIKRQMEKIEKAYQKSHEDEIALPDAKSEFVASIIVPEGLTFPTDLASYTLSGTSAFVVSSVTESNLFAVPDPVTAEAASGRKIVVTMSLKDRIGTYKDLYQKIHEDTEDTLRLVVNGIKVDDDAIGLLTVSGSVSGTMTSDATTESGGQQKFSFTWRGKQTEDGADALHRGTDAIQLTVEVADDSQLYGDASVRKSGAGAFDTEHSAVFEAKQGDLLDFEAALNVSSIRKAMERIRKKFSGSLTSDVPAVSFKGDAQSAFTLVLHASDGLIFPADPGAYSLSGSEAFNLSVQGATVTMTLKPGYDTFAKLYEAIYENTNDYMVLTITGVRIAEDAQDQVTASGEITGNFKANAADGSKLMDTSWSALQDTHIRAGGGDGTDFVLGEAKDSNPIQLTIHVSKKPVSVTPENPATPSPMSVTTAPTNTAKVLGANRTANETVPVENAAQPAEPQKVLGVKRENHQIATGDDSQMMLYGVLALAAAAGAIIWLVRYRRRER